MVKRIKSEARSAPVRVFVGTSAGGEDAEASIVLAHTLRERSSAPVDVTWLHLSRAPDRVGYSGPGGWLTERWGTPWTALRWAVPEICGWEGRAVYLDCPTIVEGDVAALAAVEMPEGAFVAVRRDPPSIRVACLVFDCAAAQKWVPGIAALRADVGAHQRMGRLLESRRELTAALPLGWGVDEAQYSGDPPGSVHFSNPYTQPHARLAAERLRRSGREHWFREVRLPHYSARLAALFEAEYSAALAAGARPEQYVPEEAYGAYEIKVPSLGAGRTRA